jgi:hypothetical protein
LDWCGEKFCSALPTLSQKWWYFKPWHLISCCWTISCPPYGSNEWCFNVLQAPGGPSVSIHATFWNDVVKSLAVCCKLWAKLDGISSHADTLSVAAEPFHALQMDQMIDVSMCHKSIHAVFWTDVGVNRKLIV